MSSNGKRDDHIILPRATLKRFAEGEPPRISVLNFSSPFKCEITKPYPKSFHTEENYYDDQIDEQVKKLKH